MVIDMSNIFIHFHIYYHDQLDYYLEKLRNIISCHKKIYVTMSVGCQSTEKKLKELEPNVIIEILPNKGYDIFPFLYVINKIDLNLYDYILKIHTKGKRKDSLFIGDTNVGDERWRDLLVDSLIKDPFVFERNLDIFAKNKKVGLIGNKQLILQGESYQNKRDFKKTLKEACFLFKTKKIPKFYYVGGTMFIGRSSIFRVFQDKNILQKCFEIPEKTGSKFFTKAHIYERMLGLAVYMAGFHIMGIFIDEAYFSVDGDLNDKKLKNMHTERISVLTCKINKIKKKNKILIWVSIFLILLVILLFKSRC